MYPKKLYGCRMYDQNTIDINLKDVVINSEKPISWTIFDRTFETTSCMRYICAHVITKKDLKNENFEDWFEYVNNILTVDEDLVLPLYRKYVSYFVTELLVEKLENMIRKFMSNCMRYNYMKNFYRKLLAARPESSIIFYFPRTVKFASENYYEILRNIILEDINASTNMRKCELACAEEESSKT